MGLARLTAPEDGQPNLTQMGTLMGTPDYIAPEQATNSRGVDIRADVYSLGCTFYYLLTGKPPFADGTVLDKIIRHQTDKPPRVQEVRRPLLAGIDLTEADEAFFRVPAAVQDILDKMLAKNPDDRFETPVRLPKTWQTCLPSWTIRKARDRVISEGQRRHSLIRRPPSSAGSALRSTGARNTHRSSERGCPASGFLPPWPAPCAWVSCWLS